MNHLENFRKNLETASLSRDHLIEKYIAVRKHSLDICKPLSVEDYVVQPCPEVSPPKWHLAHMTWFFEELILVQNDQNYKRFNDGYRLLFNSYYKSAGEHWLQGHRGHLSRPSVEEVYHYREYVDDKVINYLRTSDPIPEVDFLLEVGLHHEQQHQELLLMDIKYILGMNPTFPSYFKEDYQPSSEKARSWKNFEEGVYEIGHGGNSFAYDNEGPRHKSYLYTFEIREDIVSNGEYLQFMEDGGYEEPRHWLSEGWDWSNQKKVNSPLYWMKRDGQWFEYTLNGLVALDLNAPVAHLSYFEADAFANWTDRRLPTEMELEVYLNELEDKSAGQLWTWSKSHYSPYPGFKTYKGMIGEYNGKFMCNQFVLRGGCLATPQGHYRHSYRNFYQPHHRWMFSGIRMARDL